VSRLLDRLPFRRPPPGLTCREVVELVTDYLEDALPPADRARFDVHVAGCEHCSRYVDQMRATVAALGRIEPERLDPAARDALLDAFREWRAG
jgi:anti-sigma factor RsiW